MAPRIFDKIQPADLAKPICDLIHQYAGRGTAYQIAADQGTGVEDAEVDTVLHFLVDCVLLLHIAVDHAKDVCQFRHVCGKTDGGIRCGPAIRQNADEREVERALDKGGPCGRRLDFLMQELNREANTLSSKSVASSTTQNAVELKVLIEQMREQIQNIE